MTVVEVKISSVDMGSRKKLGIRSGDTVKVWSKIKEGEKFRLQAFDGLVLATKHGADAGATFTVRKSIDGVGVERIFPLYSPNIGKIEILRRAKVRRSKLYHIREKAAKEIRRQMRSELRRGADEMTVVDESGQKEVKKEETKE
jgi:large subunit ribosomal protein L19